MGLKKRAQSIVDYSLILLAVMGAVASMQVYLRRSLQAGVREVYDELSAGAVALNEEIASEKTQEERVRDALIHTQHYQFSESSSMEESVYKYSKEKQGGRVIYRQERDELNWRTSREKNSDFAGELAIEEE